MSNPKKILRLGVVSNAGNDNKVIPIQQVTYHGKIGKAVMWHDYGFHSVPMNDSFVIVGALNCNSEERVGFASSLTQRPTGRPGEVFLFHPDTGTQIKLNEDGDIEITSATAINITVPETTINGNLTVTGTIDATGEIASGSITMTGHRHTITGGSSAGTTSTGSG